MFSSLPKLLLTRFIINLRRLDSATTHPSDNQHSSPLSAPRFHMPTMDDVIGNLGEPLDFAEYRLEDDEDGDRDSAAAVSEIGSDGGRSNEEGLLESTPMDVEAARSSDGSGEMAFGHGVDLERREVRGSILVDMNPHSDADALPATTELCSLR